MQITDWMIVNRMPYVVLLKYPMWYITLLGNGMEMKKYVYPFISLHRQGAIIDECEHLFVNKKKYSVTFVYITCV